MHYVLEITDSLKNVRRYEFQSFSLAFADIAENHLATFMAGRCKIRIIKVIHEWKTEFPILSMNDNGL